MHDYFQEDIFNAKRLKNKLQLLEEEAAICLNSFCSSFKTSLALSFGKDSMTILHILKKFNIPAQIIMFNHSGIETPDTEELIAYTLKYYNIDNFVMTKPDKDILDFALQKIDVNAKHPVRDFVYFCLEKPRWTAMDEHKINGCILGLRAEESIGRRKNFMFRGKEYYNKRELNQILTPVANWRTDEVYAYAALEHIPFHPIYKKIAKYKGKKFARHNTPIDISFLHDGHLTFLKKEYPETFIKYKKICSFVDAYR